MTDHVERVRAKSGPKESKRCALRFPFGDVLLVCVALLLMATAARVQALVINASSSIDYLTNAPASVISGALENDTLIRAFEEVQNLVTQSALFVDHDATSNVLINRMTVDQAAQPGGIAAGTLVQSHLLHFDKVGAESGAQQRVLNAEITFEYSILGLIFSGATLEATDQLLGLGSILYPGSGGRGLVFNEGIDSIEILPDQHSLRVSMLVGSAGIDQLRVITAGGTGNENTNEVSAPTTLSLLLIGGVVVLVQVRRARRLAGQTTS